MPVAFIYQIPPVDANVAQIVSACQRPAMQIFPVSCFWKAAPRKNAHAAWTRTNSLIWPLITSSFSCTIFSDIVCCLLSEWCVVTSFYQSLQAMSPFLLFSICATYWPCWKKQKFCWTPQWFQQNSKFGDSERWHLPSSWGLGPWRQGGILP